jgi:hypothetical protein
MGDQPVAPTGFVQLMRVVTADLYPPMNDPNDRRRRTVDRRRGDRRVALTLKQYQYPLTKTNQSRIGKDFQKSCWSKGKIFRACSFLVTLRDRKRYAIDISAGQKIFLGGWSKSRLLRQYVCIR